MFISIPSPKKRSRLKSPVSPVCGQSGSNNVPKPKDVPLTSFNVEDKMVDSGSMALTHKVK